MHLQKIAKKLIIQQHLYEYKKAPLERFTFLQISSELIFVHHWIVELGSVIKVKPGVTKELRFSSRNSLNWREEKMQTNALIVSFWEKNKLPAQLIRSPVKKFFVFNEKQFLGKFWTFGVFFSKIIWKKPILSSRFNSAFFKWIKLPWQPSHHQACQVICVKKFFNNVCQLPKAVWITKFLSIVKAHLRLWYWYW